MDLTQGNSTKQIIKFALPIILMHLMNQAYSIADSVIVAKFASEIALSAMSSTIAVLMIGYCLINGASGAIHILIANEFGKKEYHKIKNISITIMLIGLIFSFLLAGIYILFGKEIFKLVSLPSDILQDCLNLLFIYSISFIPQLINGIQNSILSGLGDSKNPMVISITTQILNIILDIVAVVLLKWGAVGAALASLFCIILSVIWSQMMIQKLMNQYSNDHGRFDSVIIQPYIQIAIPSMLQQSIMSIGSLFLQRLVNINGIDAINGYTVACNINSLLIIPIVSYAVAFETFASQNIGAKQLDRVQEGYKTTIKLGLILCSFLSIVTIVFSKLFISIYLSDIDSYSYQFAFMYLILLIPNYFSLLFKQCIDGLFKANMKVYLFMISSFISLVFRIFFSYLLVNQYGLISMTYATVLGTIMATIFDLFMKNKYKY